MKIKYDLVVVGGGTSGVAAAYIASKYGLKTLIIEKNIHLGGSITSGLVLPAMKSNTMNVNCEFYKDFCNEMHAFGGQVTYSDGNDGWFNPEISKIVLDKMLLNTNCDIFYDSYVQSVNYLENKVVSIEIRHKQLSLYIEASYFLDSTGDGNFSQFLNAKILENSKQQPMTLRFNISNVDIKLFSDWLLEIDNDRAVTTVAHIDNQIHLSTAYTWDSDKDWALKPIFQKAVDDGALEDNDTAYFQLFTIPGMPNTVTLNCPRVLSDRELDPLSVYDFSKALMIARQQIWRLYNFFKIYFVGFEKSYISNIADMMGVRASRRVEGKKIYTKNDLLSGNRYENPVLHADYPIDIHSYKKDNSTLSPTKQDYELPIECLCLKDFDNVFVAGRCLSADFEAQAALRVQKSCFSMGEAVAKHVIELLKK